MMFMVHGKAIQCTTVGIILYTSNGETHPGHNRVMVFSKICQATYTHLLPREGAHWYTASFAEHDTQLGA